MHHAGEFETVVLVFGLLLVSGALISGVANRSFVSLAAVFVLAGLVLGKGGFEVLDFDPTSGFVIALATVALIVILFRDGLEVDKEMLQTEWHLPLRKLVLAMPITCAVVAVATQLFTGMSWTESFLVGALLSPTDPVLSSSVVNNPRVPRVVRHSLNLESGLNDGLALPAVLAFSAALTIGENDFVWWEFVLQDVTLGVVFGVAVGFASALIMPRRSTIQSHQKSLYALGTALAAYGLAVATPSGNGFVAVFVSAVVLGIRRPDIADCFTELAEDIAELLKVAVFVVFGSLVTLSGLFGDVSAIAIVAVALFAARPIGVFAALAGTELDTATKAFMAWFGPKGVATMAFGLLVLGENIPGKGAIFDIAALAVFCSIFLHGLTDNAGSNWLGDRAERKAAAAPT
jgi:NhaP-type Na+/H+ or K+/H+ antiporter